MNESNDKKYKYYVIRPFQVHISEKNTGSRCIPKKPAHTSFSNLKTFFF